MNAVPVVASALLGAIAVGAALDPARIPRRHIDAHAGSIATGQRLVCVARVTPSSATSRRAGRARPVGRRDRPLPTPRLDTSPPALESVDPDDELREAAATLRLRIERGATVSEAMDAWADGSRHVEPGAANSSSRSQRSSAPQPNSAGRRRSPSSASPSRCDSASPTTSNAGRRALRRSMSARVLTMVPLAMLGAPRRHRRRRPRGARRTDGRHRGSGRPGAQRSRELVDAPDRGQHGPGISMMATTVLTAIAVAALVGSIAGPTWSTPDRGGGDNDPTDRARGLVTISVPRMRRLLTARAARRAIDAALPDAVELLVLVIQAGMTPHQAIVVLARRAPSPVRPGFREVRHRIERGAPLADALRALPDTPRSRRARGRRHARDGGTTRHPGRAHA